MAYTNLCLQVYSWWLAKINMCVLLRAVTCPLFSSNCIHAVIIIFITIVLCVFIIINIKQVQSFKQVQTFLKIKK